MLEEILDVSTDEEVLLDSDDDGEINIIVAITTFMRRDLHRNEGFCEAIVPSYSMDEFRSHFRMSIIIIIINNNNNNNNNMYLYSAASVNVQ